MRLKAFLNIGNKFRKNSFGNRCEVNCYYKVSFLRNQNYQIEKLICYKIQRLFRIKLVLAVSAIIFAVPALIAGIIIVKHVL